jgi:integrase
MGNPTFSDAKTIRALPVPTDVNAVEYWNDRDSHFGVRVCRAKATGDVTRSWIVRYRDGPKWKKRTLGRITPGGLSYDQATSKALLLRLRSWHRADGVPTFLSAYETYKELGEANWSPATIESFEKSMKRLEYWHNWYLDEITKRDANALFRKIRHSVCERRKIDPEKDRRTGLGAAVSSLRLARIIFKRALEDGYITRDPLADLKRAGHFSRGEGRTPAIPKSKLKAAWDWLNSSNGATTQVVRDYLLIGLLTGMRRSILNSLEWRNLNLKSEGREHYLMHPDARGNKQRRLVPVSLPTWLVDNVLRRREADSLRHEKWILPSPKKPGSPLTDVRGTLTALGKAIKFKVTRHTLRATFGTLAHAATGDLLLTRRLLTHSISAALDRQTTASGYVVHRSDDLRDALNRTVNMLLQLVKEEPQADDEDEMDEAA